MWAGSPDDPARAPDGPDFLYLNIAEARNDSAKRTFGFRATPHFFLVNEKGAIRDSMQGVVPADSLKGALERLIAPLPQRLK